MYVAQNSFEVEKATLKIGMGMFSYFAFVFQTTLIQVYNRILCQLMDIEYILIILNNILQ